MNPENSATLAFAMHRAFALQMVGPEVAGVGAAEAAQLVEMGLITKSQALHGWTVPGVSPRMDPFQFAIMMAELMVDEAADPGPVTKAWTTLTRMRAASLKKWVERVNQRLRHRIRTGRGSIVTRNTAPDALTPAQAGAWLSARTRAGVYITKIGETARAEVRDMVRDAIANGDDWGTLRDDLDVRYGVWTRDWQRVARTELQGAYNEGVIAASAARYGSGARVARIPEIDACGHCRRLFLDEGIPRVFDLSTIVRNGTNVGRKPEDWRATVWPIHPNCLLPGTAVLTPTGARRVEDLRPGDLVHGPEGPQPVEATWVSYFDGTAVSVAGDWITDGHPIAVDNAEFRDAGQLKDGDQAVFDEFRGGVFPALGPDESPTLGAEKAGLLLILSGLSSSGMPVSAVYLNGDAWLGEGDIHHESVEKMAWHGVVAGTAQRLVNHPLVSGTELSGLCRSHTFDSLSRLLHTTHSVVSPPNEAFALARSHLVPADQHGFAPAADLDTGSQQDAADGPPGAVQVASYLFFRVQKLRVGVDDSRGVNVNFGSHGGRVHTQQRIVNVIHRPHRGPVYNITTPTGIYNTASGLRVHNCRCDTLSVPPGHTLDGSWRLVPVEDAA